MKGIHLFGLILAVIFAVGCSKNEENALPGAKPPDVHITAGTGQLNSKLGSYCWSSPGKGVCVDTAGPKQLLRGERALVVKPNETISILMDYEPKPNEVYLAEVMDESKETEIKIDKNNTFQAPGQKGSYEYAYSVWWMDQNRENTSLGDAYYAFKLEVK
ncbi:hypothetical protein [Bacillus testis]|uniref:hypothetical protein n=1 Tax=Bacillus testis TaxID=1622072 RepID=UPI00067F046C|nr:hypothetical protein [Bacillus testis]